MDSSLLLQVGTQALFTFFPVFLLATIGYGYARVRPVDTAPINAINLNVFVPLLIFNALAHAEFNWGQVGWEIAYGAGIVLGSGLLTYLLCRPTGWSVREMVPPMMFTNYGNLGLPLIPLAFGEKYLSLAVILFITGNMLHITLGFKIYDGKLNWRELFIGNAMFIAGAAGIAVNLSGFAPAGALQTGINMGAQAAIPLMLFCLGVRLREVNRSVIRQSIAPALWCPVSGLIMYLLLWHLIPLPTDSKLAIAVFAALPPALMNYIFAERFNINPMRVASVVMTSNLLSAIIIPLVLLVVFAIAQTGAG